MDLLTLTQEGLRWTGQGGGVGTKGDPHQEDEQEMGQLLVQRQADLRSLDSGPVQQGEGGDRVARTDPPPISQPR